MAWTLFHKQLMAASIVLFLAMMVYVEDSDDTLLVRKQVRLPSNLVKSFKYISHLHNMKFWTPGLSKFDPHDNHPVELGKHYKEAYYIPFYGEIMFDCVIMGYESPRHIGFVCNNWLRTRVEMNLEESDLVTSHPTLMTFGVYSRRRSFFFKYLLSPMISFYEEASTRQAMFALKYALELS